MGKERGEPRTTSSIILQDIERKALELQLRGEGKGPITMVPRGERGKKRLSEFMNLWPKKRTSHQLQVGRGKNLRKSGKKGEGEGQYMQPEI